MISEPIAGYWIMQIMPLFVKWNRRSPLRRAIASTWWEWEIDWKL